MDEEGKLEIQAGRHHSWTEGEDKPVDSEGMSKDDEQNQSEGDYKLAASKKTQTDDEHSHSAWDYELVVSWVAHIHSAP